MIIYLKITLWLIIYYNYNTLYKFDNCDTIFIYKFFVSGKPRNVFVFI